MITQPGRGAPSQPVRRNGHVKANALIVAVAVLGAGGWYLLTRPAPPQQVTYTVTGSPADVTYGPAGSDLAGTVPMRVTAPLGSAAYYAVTAQLQGSGSVACQVSVGAVVVSQAVADSPYGIARCEIARDAAGAWASVTGP